MSVRKPLLGTAIASDCDMGWTVGVSTRRDGAMGRQPRKGVEGQSKSIEEASNDEG